MAKVLFLHSMTKSVRKTFFSPWHIILSGEHMPLSHFYQGDNMKITAKFGGTSLATAKAIDNAAKIVASDTARRYVTVSAPGKRSPDDIKITDLLYSAYESGDFDAVFERFYDIAHELRTKTELSAEYRKIKDAMRIPCGRDFIASRGEYLCAEIFSDYIGFPFIDAADVIFFDDDGNTDYIRTRRRLGEVLEKVQNAVIPGFYGVGTDGAVHTFSRGGSDITGALVAASSESDIYENWTDVDGVLSADPKTIDNPAFLDIITYSELKYLSAFGASVLHEDALLPVRQLGIPVHIRNTENPGGAGTMIVSQREMPRAFVGVSGKGGFSRIAVSKEKIGRSSTDMREIFELFSRKKTDIILAAAEPDGLFIITETESGKSRTDMLLNEICQLVMPTGISYDEKIAVICAVGDDTSEITAKSASALHEAGIRPIMISAGSSGGYVLICTKENQKDEAVRRIYKKLA